MNRILCVKLSAGRNCAGSIESLVCFTTESAHLYCIGINYLQKGASNAVSVLSKQER